MALAFEEEGFGGVFEAVQLVALLLDFIEELLVEVEVRLLVHTRLFVFYELRAELVKALHEGVDLARDELFVLWPLQVPGELGVGVFEAQGDGGCAALPWFGHEFLVGRQVYVRSEDLHGDAGVGEGDRGIK